LLIGGHDFAPPTLNPYTLNPFPGHRRSTENTIQQFNRSTIQLSRPLIHTERDEKGKMKKEKGDREKAAGASIHPDESGPLGNQLPPRAVNQSPPFEGGYGG